MSLLVVKDLEVTYTKHEKQQKACHVSFEIKRGETVGIVGESGSGKSSAMLAVLGLLPGNAKVSCGQIFLDGQEITPPLCSKGNKKVWKNYERKMQDIRGKKIAMVFQDPSAYLNPLVKTGRQITETIRSHKKCTLKEAEDRAAELLDMAGIRNPEQSMKLYPFEMSGGMRQRIVIAMALACEPDLIIADEPTTALDVTVQRQILDVLQKIAARTNTSILLVSHDMGVIASVCSRVMVMKSGVIAEQGSAEQIFYEPQDPYTKMLVEKAGEVMQTAPEKPAGNVIMQAEHLSRGFLEKGGFRRQQIFEAVEDVSFEIQKGETFGLVGESGCGKTTLARILTGLLKPTTGSFLLRGKIQMIFQDPYASFDPRFSVEDILKEALWNEKNINAQEKDVRIEQMLSLVGLDPEEKKKRPSEFSGGQRQRIAIARALMHRPELLICDEPLSALDVSTQSQILDLLQQIQRETEVAYLFISHDLNVVKHISQRIAVMYLGNIMEMGDAKKIYEDPWHPYTKQLLSAVLKPDPRKMKRRRRLVLKEEGNKRGGQREGCPFACQCGYAMERCRREKPPVYSFENREVRCFLYGEEHTGKRTGPMTSQI